MFTDIEKKAQKAKSGEDAAVSELVDAVFSEFGSSAIPSDVVTRLKKRLVHAELKFRAGKKGLRESGVVRVINSLAERFGAPAYAKTSPLQVRVMRAELVRYLPSLVAVETREEKKGAKKEVGDQLDPEVSPLEATLLTMLMIQQKMLNNDWQQSPEEWPEHWRRLRSSRPQAAGGSALGSPDSLDEIRRKNQKRNEMRRVVVGSLKGKSKGDIEELVEEMFDNLGVEKTEGVQ